MGFLRTARMDIQHEKAYQKQEAIFLNKKKRSLTKKQSIRETRFYKNVGLGFKTPRNAIESNYVDKKCPFTGNVSIRGRILVGKVAVITCTTSPSTSVTRSATR